MKSVLLQRRHAVVTYANCAVPPMTRRVGGFSANPPSATFAHYLPEATNFSLGDGLEGCPAQRSIAVPAASSATLPDVISTPAHRIPRATPIGCDTVTDAYPSVNH
jgi:hypothetical protein